MHNICVKLEQFDEQLDLTWRATPLYQRVIMDTASSRAYLLAYLF